MKNFGTTRIRSLVTGAIAMAALALPTGAHALTATYNSLLANLVNCPSDCGSPVGTHKYNGCAGAVGFNWTDTIPAGNLICAVQVEFNEGVDCHAITTFNTTLNAAVAGTWTSSITSCACTPAPVLKSVTVAATGVAAYVRGAVNTFLTTSPITTCLGYSMGFNGIPATAFSRVTVTYGATCTTSTTTDPWATPLPGAYPAGQAGNIVGVNVDAKISSRSTQTSVDTANAGIAANTATLATKASQASVDTKSSQASVDTANANILAIKAKTDAFLDVAVSTRATQLSMDAANTKLDTILTKFGALSDLALKNAIEAALVAAGDNPAKPPQRITEFVLPTAKGGMLELVRKTVADAIALAAAAGYDENSANSHLNQGDRAALLGDWVGAYDGYRSAFKSIF